MYTNQAAYDSAEQDLIEIDADGETIASLVDDVAAYLDDAACDEPLSRDLVETYGWSARLTDAVCAAMGVL